MKDCDVSKVRNFAIAGHAGAGKTSLSDLILYKAGKVSRLGKVNEKNSVSDHHPIEKEKGCSIFGSSLNCSWNGHNLFFNDTPGNPDFLGDVVAGLSTCDLGLVVVDGVSGIEFGTTRAMRTALDRNCPRMIFVNSLDRDNSDFTQVLNALQDTYGKTVCVPMTLPIGKEASFSAVFSILSNGEAPAEIADQVDAYKSALMDTAAESDEELMMAYLEGEELSPEDVSRGLLSAVMKGSLVPVFCGSVEKDIGVQELLDGIVNLAPPPLAQGKIALKEGELELKGNGDGVAFVFKSIIDPFVGQLTVLRVYSGKIKSDSELFNVNTGKRERVGALLLMNGADQTNVTEAGPGDVVGIAKLTSTGVNHTLATSPDIKPLMPIQHPKPNALFAVYSKTPGDEDKIISGLQRLHSEDPTIVITREPETGEMLLIGMGMQHIGIIIQRLQETSKVEVDLRTPKVPYRETIQGKGDSRYRHKKQSGGRGQFAEVALRVEALPNEMFEFSNEVVGGNIPKNYIPAIEKGVVNTMQKGPLANCRVINIKATVYDGKYHAVDSSDMAFQIAASFAFREAMKQANPIILEPIQKVRIVIPDAYMGDVSGDLNSRRGRILGMGSEDGLQVVEAEVPLAEMFSYPSQLRSLTQGRGSFGMEFLRYDPVPGNISSQIQAAAAKEREEED